ncbi:MAG TPA: tRNA (N(6)-L-threonylcarbamoyladenosine(37)-C(2))-methylthiotransferase MtaB [Geobacteraceae bacterium]
MRKVAITTLGCKTNQFESAAMTEALGKAGYELVPFGEVADVYIINSCTVTARTDAESRKLIRRAVRRNGAARVVVTGCYAQVAPSELTGLPGVNLVMGNAEKKGIVQLLQELGDEPRVRVADIMAETAAAPLALESFAEHTRAFLQVQNGCDAFCSYCIVPYARGGSRSVPLADVLAGVNGFVTRGFQEVVLTGIHLGGYGRDLVPAVPLHDLLRAIEGQQQVTRLRLGSVEPNEVTDELINFLARSPIACQHLHLPLQSGSDGVLARMNRHYTAAFCRDLVSRLVSAVPDLAIGLDLIAGFPGESQAEFSAGFELVASLPVAFLHVFPYSRRPGTPAAAMADQLPPAVITERAARLRELGEMKKRAFGARFLGRSLPVLVQQADGNGLLTGLSRNYLPVSFPGPAELVNRELTVRLTGVSGSTLHGELVS